MRSSVGLYQQDLCKTRNSSGKKLKKKEMEGGVNGDGVLVQKSVEEMEARKNNFESLINVSREKRAEVISIGVQIGVVQPHPQGEVERSEVEGAVKKLKTGKPLVLMA